MNENLKFNSILFRDKVLEKLEKESKDWCIIASFLCNSNASVEFIDYISINQANIRGYEYLYRFIIRHSNVSINTLLELINKDRIVLSEDKDVEYKAFIYKKLIELGHKF